MSKRLFGALAGLLLSVAVAAPVAAADKPVVAVALVDSSQLPPDAGRLKLTDVVTTALANNPKLAVLDKEAVATVLVRERAFAESGLNPDPQAVIRFAQLAKTRYVIVGRLSGVSEREEDKFAFTLLTFEVRADLQAIDGNTGEVLMAASGHGASTAKRFETADGTIVAGSRTFGTQYARAAEAALTEAAKALADKLGAQP